MAWEKRGSKRVYYRSIRKGNTVRKQYFGSGKAAEQAAAEDNAKRAKRAADQKELFELQSKIDPQENLMTKLEENIRVLLDAVMFSAGFHNRKGDWRRKREE